MDILTVAVAILVILLLLVFLVGRMFQSSRTRKRILWGVLGVYALAFIAYFGFIAFVLSGKLN